MQLTVPLALGGEISAPLDYAGMDAKASTSSLDALVRSFAEWAEMGSQIVDHMKRAGERHAFETTREEALTSVLTATLAPLVDRHAASDLRATAHVMADAIEEIADQVLLVDLDALDDGDAGRDQ
jgi:hypothetical protein